MRARPPQHGRDHRVGGTDPIPFPASSGWDTSYPPYQEFPISVNETVDYQGFYNLFYDVDLPYSFYFNNWHDKRWSGGSTSTRTATDGDYFTARFSLGPKGSSWAVWFLALMDSDMGSLEMSWAKVPADTPVASPAYTTADVAVGSLDSADNLTFYKGTGGGSYFDQDFYSPIRAVEWFDSEAHFRMLGDDGDALTGFTPASAPEFVAYTADGGAGIWQLKCTARDIGNGAKIGIFRMGVYRIDPEFRA